MADKNHVFFLSREELLRLATLEGVRELVGLEITPEDLVGIQSSNMELDGHLAEKGLIKGKKIAADKRALIQALLRPERALIFVRDRPDIDKQILIFLCRDRLCLLHSFPQEKQHRIAIMKPDEIENMLNEWFPVRKDLSNDAILLTESLLADLISITNKGEIPTPLPNVDSAQSNKLIQSLLTRRWSVSIMLLEIKDGQAVNADTYTAWSGDDVEWVCDLHSPEVMRLRAGGNYFVGLQRMLVRKLAQFDRIVRAYRLSSDELAFSLMALNRGDLANHILHLSGSQVSGDRMEDASKNLQVRGLIGISPKGFPFLADDFEQALSAMVIPTRIGRIRTASAKGVSEGTLYLLKRRFFCAHYARKEEHVIECGTWEQFPTYLLSLFQGFGEKQKAGRSKPAPIQLQALTEMLDERGTSSIEQRLLQQGLSKVFAAKLAADMANPMYQASLIGINPSLEKSRNIKDHPTLLLLKGSNRDWIFSFPHERADAIGTAMQADSMRFMTELEKVLDIN